MTAIPAGPDPAIAAGPDPAIPAEVSVDGEFWAVTRAWPDGTGGATIEARSALERSVRGGFLVAASDARASRVVLHPIGHDPRLPALAALARGAAVVSHRAGRRAVLRRADRYTKIVRPGRAAGVRAAHDRARAAGFDEGFVLARSWCDADEEARGIVHFAPLRGRTLNELGADRAVGDDTFAAAWGAWGAEWSRLPGRVRTGDPLPVHSASDECAIISTWTAHAERVAPSSTPGIREAAARAISGLIGGRPDPLVAAHRDLHDKQVLFTPGAAPGILDFDTVSLAEAALDLGNLRAHLAFRAAQGHLSAARHRVAQNIVDATAAARGVSPERLFAYESATALRLGCLYLFRPAWRSLAAEWLSRGA